MSTTKTISTPKTISRKKTLKDKVYISTTEYPLIQKGPISPSSEGSLYIMAIVDAFIRYVALNPVPH